jgi:LysR family glycine cleavage system transcriptional activator
MASRRLPPLNALIAFEVSARLGSFSAAAAELGVTHGAVSRQVALLERWFGQRLFVRHGRGIVPTGPGRSYAVEVSAALDRLAEASAHYGPGRERAVVRVNAPTTFAMRWLIPRLAQFYAVHPDIAVEVTTSVSLAGRLKGGYELAIRKGERFDHHEVIRFLDEADTVIASPGLLARLPLRTLDDLRAHTLLATETRPGDWADWLEAAGLSLVAGTRQMRFDHFFVTLQAATDGLGIAVGPFPVLDGDVASGRFAMPFPAIRVARPGYVALIPADVDKTRALRRFVAWLVAEGASAETEASERG